MKKEIAKLHIFHGENDFDREENVRQWISAFKEKHGQMNLMIIDSTLEEDTKNTFARAVLEARTSSLFSGTRLIVVKIEDTDCDEKLFSDTFETFKNGLKGDAFLLFSIKGVFPKETSALLKKLELAGIAKVTEFKIPSENELKHWVNTFAKKRGCEITNETTQALLERATLARESSPFSKQEEANLFLIAHELEKLISYIHPRKKIEKEDLDALMTGGEEFKIWEMINAFLSDKKEVGVKMLEERLNTIPEKSHEGELRLLLNLLSGQLKNLLLVKHAKNEKELNDVAKKLKWSPGRIFMLKRQAENLTKEKLLLLEEKIILLYKTSTLEPALFKPALFHSLLF